jgi:hypothetical protein
MLADLPWQWQSHKGAVCLCAMYTLCTATAECILAAGTYSAASSQRLLFLADLLGRYRYRLQNAVECV